jgi:chromate transport protein ChrA
MATQTPLLPSGVRPSAAPSGGGVSWVAWLHGACALAILGLCFRGTGRHELWLALVLGVSFLGLTVSSTYRRWALRLVRALWGDVENFAASSGKRPWRAACLLVMLPAALLFFTSSHNLMMGDSRPVILTAARLVTGGDLELSEFVPPPESAAPAGRVPYYLRRTPAGVYSNYPAGMLQFALPVALIARCLGADLQASQVHERLEKWTASWLAAACLGLFFLLALHLADPAPAAMVTLLLAVGSVMFTTVAQGLWQHGGLIFWALVALLAEFDRRPRPAWTSTLLPGVACGLMLACRLTSAVFIVPFGVWVLLRCPRRAVFLAGWACAAYAPWALLYESIYGNLFGPSLSLVTGLGGGSLWLRTLPGLLVSPGRGLLVYQPWLVLLAVAPLGWFVPAHLREHRPAPPRGWAWCCAAAVVLHLGLLTAWPMWWGGACWGSRLLAESVPLLALLCLQPVAVLWRTLAGRPVVMALVLLSCLVHMPAVYLRAEDWDMAADVDHHPAVLWSWSDPPFLYPLLRR